MIWAQEEAMKTKFAIAALAFFSTTGLVQAQSQVVLGVAGATKHSMWSLSCSPKVSSMNCKLAGFYASLYTSHLNPIPVVVVTPQEFNQEVDRLAAMNNPPLPSGFCSEATGVLTGCSHNAEVLIVKTTPAFAADIGLIYVSTGAFEGVHVQRNRQDNLIAVPDGTFNEGSARSVFSWIAGYIDGYNVGIQEGHPPVR
jgi:hypothetical protein